MPEYKSLAYELTKNVISDATLKERYKLLCQGAPLPTDNTEIAKKVLEDLINELEMYNIKYEIPDITLDNSKNINIVRSNLKQNIDHYKEEKYAQNQRVCNFLIEHFPSHCKISEDEEDAGMYFNSGYLNNSRLDFKDYSKPLVVGSCGTYRLKKRPKLPTFWAKGRRDYQILYVASGKAHFWFDGVEEVVTSGHMVLYQPKEIQKYVYYVEDHPEVFWIHFTGYDVKNVLNYHGIPLDKHVFYSGTLPDYKMLFRKIIRELQQCEYGYEDYIASLFNIILLLVSRQQQESEKITTSIPEEIEAAVAYFNENYNTKVSVDDYAESLHISTNWFIRNFKQYMKISPAQYILSLRMVNAQSLLENTEYNIGEIAEIVGYDNPLYFSRVFKKEYGVSPAQYRKNLEESTEK